MEQSWPETTDHPDRVWRYLVLFLRPVHEYPNLYADYPYCNP